MCSYSFIVQCASLHNHAVFAVCANIPVTWLGIVVPFELVNKPTNCSSETSGLGAMNVAWDIQVPDVKDALQMEINYISSFTGEYTNVMIWVPDSDSEEIVFAAHSTVVIMKGGIH